MCRTTGTSNILEFHPEQVQNPEKLVKYLEEVCCHPGNSREKQITATCWGLAHAYQVLFNTIQYLQGDKKVFGSDDKMSGTLATQVPTTDTTSEPKNTPVPIPSSPEEMLEVEVGSFSKG